MGHKVTIFSFDPIPELPDGVGNSDAEVILPRAFAERLRPSQADVPGATGRFCSSAIFSGCA